LSLDQASIGEEVLDPWETADVMNLIDQGQRKDLADTWDGAQEEEVPVVVLANLVDQIELEIADDLVVGVQQGDIDGDGHLEGVVFEVLDDGATVFGLV